MKRCDYLARARGLRTCLLITVLILVGCGVEAEAGSLSIGWTAPTTNADGTPVTDLASYRIYLGTSSPACPGTPFRTVTAPTAAPTAGQTVSTVVTGLTAGTTYFSRITAVDSSGNESACSAAASAVARGDSASRRPQRPASAASRRALRSIEPSPCRTRALRVSPARRRSPHRSASCPVARSPWRRAPVRRRRSASSRRRPGRSRRT